MVTGAAVYGLTYCPEYNWVSGPVYDLTCCLGKRRFNRGGQTAWIKSVSP